MFGHLYAFSQQSHLSAPTGIHGLPSHEGGHHIFFLFHHIGPTRSDKSGEEASAYRFL